MTFKCMLQEMPEHYCMKMKAVYIVGGGIIVKLFNMISVGSLNKLLDRLFVYVEEYFLTSYVVLQSWRKQIK